MQLNEYFVKGPHLRPAFNIGCLLDIPTGTYKTGKHGESILNGGLSHFTGLVGKGNMFKSTIAHFTGLQILSRYSSSSLLIYDTELTATMDRFQRLYNLNNPFYQEDLSESARFLLTDKSVELGNAFFDRLKGVVELRIKHKKSLLKNTPFIDPQLQTPIPILPPMIVEIDSLSQTNFDVVQEMFNKHEVGSSKLNTEALKEAAVKSQMVSQLPQLCARGGMYVIVTAHVGEQHQLDPYAPPAKKLSFLKGKDKIKRVPENFTMLPNNLWLMCRDEVLRNDLTKAPEYPRDKEDNLKDDTDLMAITMQNLRAKSGPTGIPFKLVVSQRDGVHVGLS